MNTYFAKIINIGNIRLSIRQNGANSYVTHYYTPYGNGTVFSHSVREAYDKGLHYAREDRWVMADVFAHRFDKAFNPDYSDFPASLPAASSFTYKQALELYRQWANKAHYDADVEVMHIIYNTSATQEDLRWSQFARQLAYMMDMVAFRAMLTNSHLQLTRNG